MQAAVVGVTGYSGTVLYQLLTQHPAIEQINLYDHANGSDTVRYLDEEISAFRNQHIILRRYDAAAIMADNDVLFFATPAGVTSQLVQPYLEKNFPVIDLSGDMRLKDAKCYAKWYHKKAATVDQLAKASYGLAEFNTPTSNYIANPGCYATATLLGLAPLVLEKMVQVDSIIVDAKSGVSGAGKKLAASSHYAFINENAYVYKVNQHQHIPEIMQQLKIWDEKIKTIQFTTTLLPITRGIMATIYAKPKQDCTLENLKKAFNKYYVDKPFVRVLDEGLPNIKDVTYSNYCDIGFAYNEESQTIMIVSVIDNLLKGASGQAVQNMNKLFEMAENTGLPVVSMWP
ncbi:N-acetyl-gamma-glutamyl-phosphate reductase [Ligilactobacillus sp. WILCCON 0076]|uniref:N-acetyl-gamma-glutamyl-phosphate reductase n=1 Tax=Ligilactobacillus ubinensis TaxID=2876789 RepID=A0A9X2FK71_9LACO|nr:N-acetyl-gamma-glutamyl-phosphate reductase [Ligilactobacillus ubinensis]MCP0886865.1 N-acetyl-gamma-glutamyl-phosphate reductase [Ligilactobacillus ubinensis]